MNKKPEKWNFFLTLTKQMKQRNAMKKYRT